MIGIADVLRRYVVRQNSVDIIWLLIAFLPGISLADTLFVQRIGLEQGLAQNNVTSIVQDGKGFMWFGTQTALNRYDGYTFRHYKKVEGDLYSMSHGGTWALLVDSEGVLWAGTYGGLNRYDEGTDSFISYQHQEGNSDSLSHDNVWALYEDKQGNLWVGTGEGLNRFDREKETFVQYLHSESDQSSISSNFINAIYQDSSGALWVATDRGLNRYDYETQQFENIGGVGSPLKNSVVTTIVEDANGRLWVGTDGNGIFILDDSRQSISQKKHDPKNFNSVSTDKIKVIIKDGQNRLWVGTDNGGLNRVDENSDRFIRYKHNPSDPNSLSENNIFSLYEDRSGVLWIGTYTQGLSKLNPYGFSLTLALEYQTLENPDPHTDIRGFLVDQYNSLWVGSSNNGLRVTLANGEKIAYRHDPEDPTSLGSDKVYTIFEDSDGIVWVGAANGWLHEYDRKNDRFIRYQLGSDKPGSIRHGKILAIEEDSQGLLWVGIERGAAHTFNRKTKEVVHYHHDPNNSNSISFDRVFDIHIDKQDNIWFGTYGGGLSYYDRVNRTFTNYLYDEKNKNSIRGNYISFIHNDEQDENILWLGCASSGLNRFNMKTGEFKLFGVEYGVPDDTHYGAVQDGQYLWVSHNKGVSRFDKETLSYHNYEQQDGLQNNEFNGGAYYKAPDGKLYLGGISGYNAFFTEQIADNPYPPSVYITQFQLFNKAVKINEEHNDRVLLPKSILDLDSLTLSYKDTVFSFEFSALDYAFSNKNQYAYKMEGLEDEWNYVDSKRRFATYTTLPPGDYVFHVKASNNNGVWNEQGASLKVIITPPFWQTWWFRIFATISVILVVFAIYAYRVKSIQERNRILKAQVKEATAELEKEKSNLEATLTELGETKDALIEAAHKAGMADTATGVLHNVGNLLNSVNTSAGVMREVIDASVSKKFMKAGELMEANKENIGEYLAQDPKGSKLPGYFMGLMKPFKNENDVLKDNILRLQEKINAIAETIAAQQRHAKGGAFVEVLSLSDLVDDSISLQSGSINRHEIRIEKDYDETLPKLKVQKSKVVQILVNLYKNAKESMDACPNKESVLTITINQDEMNAYIKYSDTGLGIEKERLGSIFAQGFTTKAEGHGFGLHSCANYMTEMGGRLWAESDGLDKGATFIMSFPMKSAAANDEHKVPQKKIA